MSKKKANENYETIVVKDGNGARIKSFKKFIGRKAKVTILFDSNNEGQGMSALAMNVVDVYK
jgi:putative transposon-encoded protein